MVRYAVLGLIFIFALFMGYSAFGWMGFAYVAVVPIPLYLFGLFTKNSREKGDNAKAKPLTIWTSPVPYLSALFILAVIVQLIF